MVRFAENAGDTIPRHEMFAESAGIGERTIELLAEAGYPRSVLLPLQVRGKLMGLVVTVIAVQLILNGLRPYLQGLIDG